MHPMTIRAGLADAFRRLHRPQNGTILVLPNAWDALSAALIEHTGARAIATTSAGVSWSLGRPDGQGVAREEMLEAVRRIADAVQVPVTADVESGYGSGSPEAPSIAELAALGVARVSVGPAITRAAMATIRTAARE